MTLYKLFWDDFCSIYLEIIKPEFGKGAHAPPRRLGVVDPTHASHIPAGPRFVKARGCLAACRVCES